MAPPSKKRKLSRPTSQADLSAAQDVFRKHFESQFAPLPKASSNRSLKQRSIREEASTNESGSEEEWSGIDDEEEDDEEDEQEVEVVDYSSIDRLDGEGRMDKKERRAFMVISFSPTSLFYSLLG
jgi:hypothetical protein